MDLLKVIKFEGDDDTLVWKHPEEDFNTESQLIVHESQEAILFKDGKALDIFGPGRYTLETQNIPLLRNLINIPTEGDSRFHCEVYFINKAVSLNMKWGTNNRFQVLDPQFNIPLSVGASGSMEFIIDNSRKFLIKVVGTQSSLSSDKLLEYFREKTVTKVKKKEEISEAIGNKLNEDYEVYGVDLVNFYVSTIFVPDEDTAKVKEVLNKQLEYGTLNFNWADEQIADISKKYASNPGSQENVGGMMAQIPIAMAFGEMLKGSMPMNNLNPFGERAQAFNQSNNKSSNNDKLFCSNCGKELPENAKFCPNCGQKFESETKCPKCGYKINMDDNFCVNCGMKLKEE